MPRIAISAGGGVTIEDAAGVPITDPRIEVDTVAGPNPYAAGGFTVDLSARFASIAAFKLWIETTGPNLGAGVRFRIERDTPGAGQVRVSIFRARYDRASAPNDTGGVKDQPAGVGIATSLALEGAPTTTVDAGAGLAAPDPAGGDHRHGTIFQHEHPGDVLAQTVTDAALAEMGAVDLSGTTFGYEALGSAA